MNLETPEDVMGVSEIGWSRAPDVSVLQFFYRDVPRWHVCGVVIRIDVAPLRFLSGPLDFGNAVLDKHLQPFGHGGDPEQGVAAIRVEEEGVFFQTVDRVEVPCHPSAQDTSNVNILDRFGSHLCYVPLGLMLCNK